MLLAVEGGGFFYASASGYSKGLSLLLLGQRSEEKPRVAPWNQHQLVDQESDAELHLASANNQPTRGCASFVCFGRTSVGLDSPSPLKVGPAQQEDVSPGPLILDNGNDPSAPADDNNNFRKVALKSSIKRPQFTKSVDDANEREASDGKGEDALGAQTERRVQWTDNCGSELVEIREFEPSDNEESDDEFENGNYRSCYCAIM